MVRRALAVFRYVGRFFARPSAAWNRTLIKSNGWSMHVDATPAVTPATMCWSGEAFFAPLPGIVYAFSRGWKPGGVRPTTTAWLYVPLLCCYTLGAFYDGFTSCAAQEESSACTDVPVRAVGNPGSDTVSFTTLHKFIPSFVTELPQLARDVLCCATDSDRLTRPASYSAAATRSSSCSARGFAAWSSLHGALRRGEYRLEVVARGVALSCRRIHAGRRLRTLARCQYGEPCY